MKDLPDKKHNVVLPGGYELLEIIGEGSFSVVYKAFDHVTRRNVAVKKLKTTGIPQDEVQEAKDYFIREMKFLKNLDHPSIPKFYNFIDDGGRFYIVMELVEGDNLLEIMKKEGPLSEGKAFGFMVQVADALSYLQKQKTPIIYKDLKPSNLVLTRDERIKIIDFGAARYFTQKEDTYVLGTPGYAPQESYGRAFTDPSADVYSFGATFFHLVTGQEPFQFKFKFPSSSKYNAELSFKFCRVINDCLQPRERRITDAVELKERLSKADPLYEIRWVKTNLGKIIGDIFKTNCAALFLFICLGIFALPLLILYLITIFLKLC